jgi:ribosomal protein S18 acetylase RimI-like enzyme
MNNLPLTCIPCGRRADYLPLLLLADESLQQVRSYMDSGDLYVYSRKDADVIGIVLAIPIDSDAVELKAVAIDQHEQGRGNGTLMLSETLSELRARGYQRVVVGTANAAIGQLAFYQKAGFRMLRIERDFFSPDRGYAEMMIDSGIRLRDMVWMDLPLTE